MSVMRILILGYNKEEFICMLEVVVKWKVGKNLEVGKNFVR